MLVNGIVETSAQGQSSWSPRPQQEIDLLRELVETAVGYDANRGDVVTIKSFEFLPPLENGTIVEASLLDGLAANAANFVQIAILALVVLGLGLFVVRPILASQPLAALPGPEEFNFSEDGVMMAQSEQLGLSAPDGPAQIALDNDPVNQLRQLISERQDETVEVLRNWIETSEESA